MLGPDIQIACLASQTRYKDRDDILVLLAPEASRWAALFTTNACAAAPVQLARQRLQAHADGASLRALLVNAGNANAVTGARGLADAEQLCSTLAQQLGLSSEQVLPCSTGIIGEYLPVPALVSCLSTVGAELGQSTWERAARAIWTTDTTVKLVQTQFNYGGKQCRLVGIAKGSGMVHPNMATMIAILATDAGIAQAELQSALRDVNSYSFNAISVDGDTSTNDSVVLISSGAVVDASATEKNHFHSALHSCCCKLANELAADGEGVSRTMGITVRQARDAAEARRVAFSIANSPLVKTALHAADPNWGRIVSAVGQAGLEDFDQSGMRLWLGDSLVVNQGAIAPTYSEAAGARAMQAAQVSIKVELGRGRAYFNAIGCDLSAEYVRINSDYRS